MPHASSRRRCSTIPIKGRMDFTTAKVSYLHRIASRHEQFEPGSGADVYHCPEHLHRPHKSTKRTMGVPGSSAIATAVAKSGSHTTQTRNGVINSRLAVRSCQTLSRPGGLPAAAMQLVQ